MLLASRRSRAGPRLWAETCLRLRGARATWGPGWHTHRHLQPEARGPSCTAVTPPLPAQVTVLLHLADVAVRLAWRRALDPDDHCIPYLTGLGDLLGTGLLALCFLVHELLWTGVRPGGPLDPAPGPS